MKKILGIITALCLMAGASYAGCGKKVTNTGTLKSYNAEKKTIMGLPVALACLKPASQSSIHLILPL